jgi:hypothetical protein
MVEQLPYKSSVAGARFHPQDEVRALPRSLLQNPLLLFREDIFIKCNSTE